MFDDAKAQHETEKTKLTDEMSALKEANHSNETENQSLKLRITEQKATIESQQEKIR